MNIFNKGFNFLQDGPGNRLVYHLQGCNMHCIWCSNPEGMSINGGKSVSISEIFFECQRSKMMFFSGGGVTFTGGEATLQFDELNALCKMLKNEKIHTAIETNGTSPKLQTLLENIDYLIMDFKHYDDDILKKFTGIDTKNTKLNYETNCKNQRQQHIRIPLINGVNSDNPLGFAEYFKDFDNTNTVFEFLPYHEYGKEKWMSEYKVKNGFINKDTLNKFNEAFKKYNLKTVRT